MDLLDRCGRIGRGRGAMGKRSGEGVRRTWLLVLDWSEGCERCSNGLYGLCLCLFKMRDDTIVVGGRKFGGAGAGEAR